MVTTIVKRSKRTNKEKAITRRGKEKECPILGKQKVRLGRKSGWEKDSVRDAFIQGQDPAEVGRKWGGRRREVKRKRHMEKSTPARRRESETDNWTEVRSVRTIKSGVKEGVLLKK